MAPSSPQRCVNPGVYIKGVKKGFAQPPWCTLKTPPRGGGPLLLRGGDPQNPFLGPVENRLTIQGEYLKPQFFRENGKGVWKAL